MMSCAHQLQSASVSTKIVGFFLLVNFAIVWNLRTSKEVIQQAPGSTRVSRDDPFNTMLKVKVSDEATRAATLANGTALILSPGSAPSLTSGSVNTLGPGSAPSLTPGSFPSLVPGSAPSLTPGSFPSLVAGSAPSLTPGSFPTLVPGSAPSLGPGSFSSLVRATAPSLTPGSFPSLIPGSTPSLTSGEAPTLNSSLTPTVAPELASVVTDKLVGTNITHNQGRQLFHNTTQVTLPNFISKHQNISSEAASVVKPIDAIPTAPTKESSSIPTDIHARALPVCDAANRTLYGRIDIRENNITATMLLEVAKRLGKGGRYTPPHCRSPTLVAIIMPYRDRESQMPTAMFHFHTFLQRQLIEYQIFVVEQVDQRLFNRAMLFNVGYTEARRIAPFDCFIFSDVDLLPLDDQNIYNCEGSPKHMSAYVDKLDGQYKTNPGYLLHSIFGGVVALTNDHVRLVNGFSNIYFGWGGEDDDLLLRTSAKSLRTKRLIKPEYLKYGAKVVNPKLITEHAHYHALGHARCTESELNVVRFTQLKSAKQRQPYDGLNCLRYALETEPEVKPQPLFTLIRVSLDEKRTKNITNTQTCLGKQIPV